MASVARRYNIPYATLHDRWSGRSSGPSKGPRTIFNVTEEEIIARHIKYMARCQLPVDKAYVLSTAETLLRAEKEEGLTRTTAIPTAKIDEGKIGESWWRVSPLNNLIRPV